jgi:hypothetical protein
MDGLTFSFDFSQYDVDSELYMFMHYAADEAGPSIVTIKNCIFRQMSAVVNTKLLINILKVVHEADT